jgi:hypothetical protein
VRGMDGRNEAAMHKSTAPELRALRP